MKKKLVGIVIFMLVVTTVVSATNNNVKKDIQTTTSRDVLPTVPGLNWGVDQKNIYHSGYGITLIPPETNAQSFTPTKDKLTAVSLGLFKAGTPAEPVQITVSIRDNLTGPDLANKTIDTSVVTIGKAKWILFDFEDISITPGNTYFIVCSGTVGNADNAYCWLFADNDTYTGGEAWHKPYNWSGWIKWPSGVADFCFKTYFRKPLDIPVSTTYETLVNPLTHVNVKEKIQPISVGVDVPVWKKGDTWLYNFHELLYKYDANGTLWYKSYHNSTLNWEVTDDTGDNYTIKWTSTNNEGRATIGKYNLKFTPFIKYLGESVIRKSDLASLREVHQEKGFVIWLIGNILPFPAQYNHFVESNYTSGYKGLPFPFSAGTPGIIPGTNQIWREKCSLYWGFISLFNWPEQTAYVSPTNYNCEMANITVPAGPFNAYNISIDLQYGLGHYSLWRYYVPEVGQQVKFYINGDWDNTGKPGTIAELELVSFNHTP